MLGSDLLAYVLVAIILLIGVPAFFFVVSRAGELDRVNKRLDSGLPASKSDGAGGGSPLSIFADLFTRVGEAGTPINPEQLSQIRFKLLQAGYPGKQAVSRYFAARLLCVIIPQIVLLFVIPPLRGMHEWAPVMTSLGLAVFGLGLPERFLNMRIDSRRQAASDGFPDMMDLMVACVEAGLSLDAAVLRVGSELDGRHDVLAEQLSMISLELRAGRPSKVAWRNFADRIDLEEAGSLATMLRQAEEMGTSLGHTLRIFSKDMRQRRMLIAEEKAMALPAKMTVPLIVFVFPVLLGVLILPAAFRFGDIFGSV